MAPLRRIQRSIYEEARHVARALAKTEAFERSRSDRKRVEMLFAHLKRMFRLGRLRLRGPCVPSLSSHSRRSPQNLRRLARLLVRPPRVTEACFARKCRVRRHRSQDIPCWGADSRRLTQELRASRHNLSSRTSATKSAQSGHTELHRTCPLLGVKRTLTTLHTKPD